MNQTATVSEMGMLPALQGAPSLDINKNTLLAISTGRPAIALLTEAVRLMRGPGRLSVPEYLYYRLWDRTLTLDEKRAFVGKRAQHLMHLACNDRHWYQTAADKILFQTIMTGAGLPVPETLAVTQPIRWLPQAQTLSGAEELAGWLRDPRIYPLFAKPAAGKYSLNVLSIDRFDPDSNQLVLLGGATISPTQAAEQMRGRNGYVLQRRLSPHPRLAQSFGPRLWSVRVLVLVRPDRPIIHRALAKIATGANPADNYWRAGNMLAALDTTTGEIKRVVRGAGADLIVCTAHPDTGAALVGTTLPDWVRLRSLVTQAACVFPGIRTQSWDIALTDRGPVCLEVNYGGDLNLAQLAEGRGVLDEAYRNHLSECGYRC
jgi:Sugar-transfer associated ATP-grasp